ncbi:hypothetical protein GCM10027278_21310 [Paralcaligenes ginsengisoli]
MRAQGQPGRAATRKRLPVCQECTGPNATAGDYEREDGHTGAMRGRMLSAAEYNTYLGLAEVGEWEERFQA